MTSPSIARVRSGARAWAMLALLALPALAQADEPYSPPKIDPSAPVPKDAMPLTGLKPARPDPGACVYRYPVGTTSAACQAFVDQGLGAYYSYVYIEAARCFETALTHDADCAYAWLMLHRAVERYGRAGAVPAVGPYLAALGGISVTKLPDRVGKTAKDYALEQARKLMPRANSHEQLLIQARLQELGMWPNTPPDARRKNAAAALDELLTLHDDDQEAWFWRAQVSDGPNAQIPFYKALLRVNPLHPGANHELVHFYENIKRPALGWPFAENYIKSSPGIPHAFHMQAHLGTRIGKWGQTCDWSWRAIELEKSYHQYQEVKPSEDHQFNHHMETLTRGLVHDGRFAECRQIKGEAEGYGYKFRPEWFKMALGQRDWAEAEKLVEQFRKQNKTDGAYYAALLYLEKGELGRAGAEIDVLRQQQQTRKNDSFLNRRVQEAQGRYLCATGDGPAGLKMLKAAVDATKNDYNHHSWGNGAVLMEAWGVGALDAGDVAIAEEAFQEALAHDAGSVRGALGMWALCDRLGRSDEAARYLKVAHRVWSHAELKDFEALKAELAAKAAKLPRPMTAASR